MDKSFMNDLSAALKGTHIVLKESYAAFKKFAKVCNDTLPVAAKGLLVTGVLLAAGLAVSVFPGAAAIAASDMILGTGTMAAIGTGYFAVGEIHTWKKREVSTNQAGQTIAGENLDLRLAALTQKRINALTASFNTAAELPQETQEKITGLKASYAKSLARITILDSNNQPIPDETYKFTRPRITTTNEPV
jgi:hypothetical protein